MTQKAGEVERCTHHEGRVKLSGSSNSGNRPYIKCVEMLLHKHREKIQDVLDKNLCSLKLYHHPSRERVRSNKLLKAPNQFEMHAHDCMPNWVHLLFQKTLLLWIRLSITNDYNLESLVVVLYI